MIRSILILTVLAAAIGADAEEARRRYNRGEYAAAAELYRTTGESDDSPLGRYNLGTALLASGDFAGARDHLRHATLQGEGEVRQAAHYNLGNSYLFPALEVTDLPEQRAMLQLAVSSYKEALLQDSKDFDAKWNLELALRLLAEEPPSPTPQAAGGGGGAGEGGESGETGDPSPQPADGAGPQPQLSPDQAERLISSAENREIGRQQEKLRRPQPPVQSH
ncbi:hypothetical protein BH23GEM6_BH23GEM6_06210 [soil metagenome]